MSSLLSRAPILAMGVLLQSSCAAVSWPTTQAGQHSVAESFGIGSLYKVDSTITILDSNSDAPPSEVAGDMKGRIGLGVQAEYFQINFSCERPLFFSKVSGIICNR